MLSALAPLNWQRAGGDNLCGRGHLQGNALNDLQRVNDIAERLGHLPAMRVAHHAVQVHMAEGHLACADSSSVIVAFTRGGLTGGKGGELCVNCANGYTQVQNRGYRFVMQALLTHL